MKTSPTGGAAESPFRVSIERDLPARLFAVELDQPLPDLTLGDSETGKAYASALVLARLHGQPLGYVKLEPTGGDLRAVHYGPAIWASFGRRIVAHLREDGLPEPAALDAGGLPSEPPPRCRQDREAARLAGPPASVVIPTRDRADRVAECLAALARQSYPRFEVIVVENAPSTSATADLLRDGFPGLPGLTYVREDRVGTSRARNRGCRLASGEIVAFLDDDALPDPDWLLELVRGFGTDPRVAAVNGLILPRELETAAQVWFEEFSGFSRGFVQRRFDLDRHRPADRLFPFTTGRLGSGTTMAFRRSTLLGLGGFDVALGGGTPALGGEDLAVYFQVLARGYQLVYQPTAIVYHAHRREYAALRRQLFSYGQGLTAYLTKCVLDDPTCLFALLAKAPFGLWYALDARSAKNQRKTGSYPAELSRLELQGMLRGPLTYLLGRWRARGSDRPTAAPVLGRASAREIPR